MSSVLSGAVLRQLSCIILTLVWVASCQGNHSVPVPGSDAELHSTAIADITAAPVPTGVDPEVFEILRDELLVCLRVASTAPTGQANAIHDLAISGNDTDGYSLTWSYRNTGDYNLDGLVGVSDLTPLGIYYECALGDSDWPQAQPADGNGDGRITVADITPIGQNYDVFLAGYTINGADEPSGPWTKVDSIPLPDLPGADSGTITFNLASHDYLYYQVVPTDGDGTEGTQSQASLASTDPAAISVSGEADLSTAEIALFGGTLIGPDEGGRRIEVHFPGDAIAASTEFTLGELVGSITQSGVPLSGRMLYLASAEPVEFSQPVIIDVPVTAGTDHVTTPFRVAADGSLIPLRPVSHDQAVGTASFEINFAGEVAEHSTSQTYSPGLGSAFCLIDDVVYDSLVYSDPEAYAYSCGFNPALDGFSQFPTEMGSTQRIGRMVFAIWYWRNYRDSLGSLSERFTDSKVQEIIASRTTASFMDRIKANLADIDNSLSPDLSFATVRQAIRRTKGPVLVNFTASNGDSTTFVAYGYRGDDLLVFDPYQPGQKLTVNPAAAGCKVLLVSTGSFIMDEPLENILLDATADPPFAGSGDATITITSHISGEMVDNSPVSLEGYVTSGHKLVSRMFVWNSMLPPYTIQELPIDLSGDFSITIPVNPGENPVVFLTQSAINSYSGKPFYSYVNNNYQGGEFILRVDDRPGVIHGTVTDAESGDPVQGAKIHAEPDFGGGVIVESNTAGEYRIDSLSPGQYVLKCTAEGHNPSQREVNLAADGELEVDFSLVLGMVDSTMRIELAWDEPQASSGGTLKAKLTIPVITEEGEEYWSSISEYKWPDYAGSLDEEPYALIEQPGGNARTVTATPLYPGRGLGSYQGSYIFKVESYYHSQNTSGWDGAQINVYLDDVLFKQIHLKGSALVYGLVQPALYEVFEYVPSTGDFQLLSPGHVEYR